MSNLSLTTTLSDLPRTLLIPTRARVDEHQRPNGIFRDPHVAAWWPSLQWDSALDDLYGPLAQLGWAAHLFDQIVQQHLSTYAVSNKVKNVT